MQNVSCLTRTGRIAEESAKYVTVSDAKPKLLDRLRDALRARHYSRRTKSTYCLWVKRFIFFHHVRHPAGITMLPGSAKAALQDHLRFGHKDVSTTMAYTHVLNKGGHGVRSPADEP